VAAAGQERPGSSARPRPLVGGHAGDELLTVEQAAERYGFTPRRLRTRLAMGAFPGAFQTHTDAGPAWLIPARTFAGLGYHPVGGGRGAIRPSEAPQARPDAAARPHAAGAGRPRADDRPPAGEGRRRRPVQAAPEADGQDGTGPNPVRRRRKPRDPPQLEDQLHLELKQLDRVRGSLLGRSQDAAPPQ
jgi:hypothetical protein